MDDPLFQIPPGYQKMAMPGMGGARMSMGSAGSEDEDDEDEDAPKPPAKGKKK